MTGRRIGSARVACALTLLVAFAALAAPALARPGGGGTFSNPSRSSGGSGSRSSSGSGYTPTFRSSRDDPKPAPREPSYRSSSPSSPSEPIELKPLAVAHLATPGKARAGRSETVDTASFVRLPSAPASWPTVRPSRPGRYDWKPYFTGTMLLGVPALCIGALVVSSRRKRKATTTGWTSGTVARASTVRLADVLRQTDPDFSLVLFEDFLNVLYTECHMARRRPGGLDRLAPYLRRDARKTLALRGHHPVRTVIVGSMQLELHAATFPVTDTSRQSVAVTFIANYAEVAPSGAEAAYWVEERWLLHRAVGAKSRSPERARTIDCPGCGAALDRIVGGKCGYCDRVVDGGDFDWVVDRIELIASGARGPVLTEETVEQGTDLPTVVAADLGAQLATLKQRPTPFVESAFQERVQVVFDTMQIAWSTLDWERARPFLSDNLWQAQTYWIDAYRREGLRNVTEQAKISRLVLARAVSDRHYDAVTVRVCASSLDYTVRATDGALICGSRSRRREYTEYWTLIRGVGAPKHAHGPLECPSCGGALKIGMAGDCSFCGVKVTAGAFDWVLARIEQDEAYVG